MQFIDIRATAILFIASKILSTKQGDYLLLSYTSLKVLCDIDQFFLNIVIIVTSFVWVKHHVFVVAIVPYECDILIL